MPVPRSGPLAAWARAWTAGRVSVDQVVDAVTGRDAPHLVTGVGTATTAGLQLAALPLLEVLVAWRRDGSPVQALLPVPGDVRGVPGPAPFRVAALDAGEAVAVGGIGIVPEVTEYAPSSASPTVLWRSFAIEALPPDHLTVAEAQYELTTTIRESASALAAADVAGSRGDVAELLGGARRAGERLNLPPGHPAPAIALLSQAERLQAVLDLVSADPSGGAVDRVGLAARAEALRPLATAVRRARLAAFNA